ncbi:MAG: hypothetical protein AAF202_11450, partial [Pseudomonadota bacterium]
MKLFWILALIFCSSQAFSGTYGKSTVNGRTFIGGQEGSACGIAISSIGALGSEVIVGGVSTSRLIPIHQGSQSEPLIVDIPSGDDVKVMNTANAIVIVESGSESKVELTVYSSKSVSKPVEGRVKIEAGDQMLKFKPTVRDGLQSAVTLGGRQCLMEIAGGQAVAVYGTCLVMRVILNPADRVRVYDEGVFAGKSDSAVMEFSDVMTAIGESDSTVTSLLSDFIDQPEVMVTESELFELVSNISSSSSQT